ncbi:MAG: hypothetical protein QG567_736 [Campylobacterota bacterium]|nr:hypothetical protein [Campylobacterota bacterium]MDQ1339584.1 hypothetical protein [Campylobacterota bacterium]
MRKIYFFIVLTCAAFGDEMKIKDVNAMIGEEKKVILIDKKDLNKFISDRELSHNIEVIEMPKIRGEISIKTFKDYINSLKYISDKNHDIKYEANLDALLAITKYIFLHKLGPERYEEIKPLLLEEGKKYQKINQKEFQSALNNMSYAVACEIYEDVSSLVK